MTPSARIQAAIEILEALENVSVPSDRYIRDFFRARRYAGSKDRAAVAERVYDVLRHRSSYRRRMGSDAARAGVIGSLLADGKGDIEALFGGNKYAAQALSEAERAAIASPLAGDPPLHVRGEFPQFLESEFVRAFGPRVLDEMLAMQGRAAIDLRVNTLKSRRDDVLATLLVEGISAKRCRYSPLGIRLPAGAKGLERTELFEDGAYEFQDEAAQIASLLVGAQPGSRILDIAAGAGGKALALAAAMNNRGEIVASDIDAGRLRQIAPRAERAGAAIISVRETIADGELFDAALVDAPCSGTGTWRRQPELRWRLTSARLAELITIQDSLLERASAHVRPGGRLIYATCSLLPCENEDRIAAFRARHREFSIRPVAEIWAGAPLPGSGEFFKASPLSSAMDGFFTAILERETASLDKARTPS
jgi:16S rRNA (cytosine967-C5)-methyltransferase